MREGDDTCASSSSVTDLDHRVERRRGQIHQIAANYNNRNAAHLRVFVSDVPTKTISLDANAHTNNKEKREKKASAF